MKPQPTADKHDFLSLLKRAAVSLDPKGQKNRFPVLPAIIAVNKLIHVSLQVLLRDLMESPVDWPFQLAPETFDWVGVNLSADAAESYVIEVHRIV